MFWQRFLSRLLLYSFIFEDLFRRGNYLSRRASIRGYSTSFFSFQVETFVLGYGRKMGNSQWGLYSRLSPENKCRLVSHFVYFLGGAPFKFGPCGRLCGEFLVRWIDFKEGILTCCFPLPFVWCVYRQPSLLTISFFIMRWLKSWWIDFNVWRECLGAVHSLSGI